MEIWTCKYCPDEWYYGAEDDPITINHRGPICCDKCYNAADWVVEYYPNIGARYMSVSAGHELFSKQSHDRRTFTAFDNCPECKGKGYIHKARPRIQGRFAGITDYACNTCSHKFRQAEKDFYAGTNRKWHYAFQHYKLVQIRSEFQEAFTAALEALDLPTHVDDPLTDKQKHDIEGVRKTFQLRYGLARDEIDTLARRLYPYPSIEEWLGTIAGPNRPPEKE